MKTVNVQLPLCSTPRRTSMAVSRRHDPVGLPCREPNSGSQSLRPSRNTEYVIPSYVFHYRSQHLTCSITVPNILHVPLPFRTSYVFHYRSEHLTCSITVLNILRVPLPFSTSYVFHYRFEHLTCSITVPNILRVPLPF